MSGFFFVMSVLSVMSFWILKNLPLFCCVSKYGDSLEVCDFVAVWI